MYELYATLASTGCNLASDSLMGEQKNARVCLADDKLDEIVIWLSLMSYFEGIFYEIVYDVVIV